MYPQARCGHYRYRGTRKNNFCTHPPGHEGKHSYQTVEDTMQYAKGTLRQKAVEVRQQWLDQFAATQAKEMERYEKDLKVYNEVHKPKNLEVLKRYTEKVKKGIPFNTYGFRDEMKSAPDKPKNDDDGTCHPKVKNLDNLIEVLDTISDEEITATALSRAGIKDLASLLRRPC